MTEQELLLGLRNKEEAAFKELVSLYQDRVFNTALGFLQNQSDAEDISQEVFIQVYRSIHQFKEESLLATWIYRITTTKSLDHVRKRKRKKRFGFITSLFGEDNKPLYEPQDFNHPGVLQENKEDASLLFKLVNELPENQRKAFILNKVEELSYKEIAEILQTSEAAIDSLLQRAKLNLRKKIKEFPS